MRLPWLWAAGIFLFFSPFLSAAPLPWKDGEVLDYQITWANVPVALAQFAAHKIATGSEAGSWRFDLELRSLGMIESLKPIRDHFYCVNQSDLSRSLEYGEDRSEGSKITRQVARIDWASGKGTLRDEVKMNETAFSVPMAALKDPGFMLYDLRRFDVSQPGARCFQVYDGTTIHHIEVAFLRREGVILKPGTPPVPSIVLYVRPLYDDPTKDAKNYGFTLWLSDNAERIPLQADLQVRFGTFRVERVLSPPPSSGGVRG